MKEDHAELVSASMWNDKKKVRNESIRMNNFNITLLSSRA